MARQPAEEPILEAVTVPVPVEQAFSAFVDLARWWPRVADLPRPRPRAEPGQASEVEIRFHPAGPSGTRVELEHRDFARHGDAAGSYRQGMASPEGWPHILDRYAAALR